MKNIKKFEEHLKYKFRNKKLLEQALKHTSYTNEAGLSKLESNQRLEFLGDSVLELITREFFYTNSPNMLEGEMSKNKASVVCEPSLATCAREIQLGEFLQIGKGEELMGGRDRDSIISDAFEAVIGAIYLDGGFASAKDFVNRYVLNDLEEKKLFYDSKTILQEVVQGKYETNIEYVLVSESGPDHNKIFESEVYLQGKLLGRGEGKTKKSAEQKAAYYALKILKKK